MPKEDQDNVHTEGAAMPVPPGQRRRRLALPIIAAAVALVIGAAGGAGGCQNDASDAGNGAADAGGDFGHARIEPRDDQRQGRRDLRQ